MQLAYVTADHGIPVFGAKGASIHVREMVNAFSQVGHDVRLLAARCGASTARLAAEVIKVRVEEKGWSADWTRDPKERRNARERHALDVSEEIRRQLIALHGERSFDFLYERYGLFSTAAVRASRQLGITSVVEVNSPLIEEQKKFRDLVNTREAEAVEAEVFETADLIVAVSDQVRDYIRARRPGCGPLAVIPNGVDRSRFHPDVAPDASWGPGGRFVVGFVGSLKPWHGLEYLLEAFRTLARSNGDSHLLIVGDGPLRGWIEGFARGADIDSRVTITGWVPHERLPALIKSMSVAVAPYPAMEDFYFSPLKLYEYMALGIPVVASRIGQIDMVLRHEGNALLPDPGDAGALADGLRRLYRDEQLRNRLGAAAHETAKECTWENNARRVTELVCSLGSGS